MNSSHDLPESGPLQSEFLQAQSQAEFKAIFETSKDFIWTVDAERFSFMTCNPAFRNYFAGRYGVVLRRGMISRDYLPQEMAGIWVEFYKCAIREDHLTAEYKTADKANVFTVSLSTLKRDDGEVFGISVVCRDITDQRFMEAALRESEERFLSGV